MSGDHVTLNVGGTRFVTTKGTLCGRFPDNMLAKLVSGRWTTPSKDGEEEVFVDRDGALFPFILKFLRDGFTGVPKDLDALRNLKDEADFYQIPMPFSIPETETILLNIGGQRFETTEEVLLGRFPDSKLARLVKKQLEQCGNALPIFVDRNGNHFQYILDFLRDGKPKLPREAQTLAELKRETDFYKIPFPFPRSEKIRVNVNGFRAEYFKRTLTERCPNSKLAQMVRECAEEEELFIDRERKHFLLLVSFLRNGHGPLPRERSLLQEIRAEAEFFDLEFLVTQTRELLTKGFLRPGDQVLLQNEIVSHEQLAAMAQRLDGLHLIGSFDEFPPSGECIWTTPPGRVFCAACGLYVFRRRLIQSLCAHRLTGIACLVRSIHEGCVTITVPFLPYAQFHVAKSWLIIQ